MAVGVLQQQRPFMYDTAWDCTKVIDWLCQRPDVDPTRIGITGVSLGGMHAWLTAAADPRIAAVVPLIGVQGYRWALDNEAYMGRVGSTCYSWESSRLCCCATRKEA